MKTKIRMIPKKYRESCEMLSITVDESFNNDHLKSSFRKLVIEYHPDKGGDENKFKQLNSAHEYIKKNQDAYKKYLKTPTIDDNVSEFIDSMDTFFTSKRMKHRASVDIVISLELSVQNIDDTLSTMVMYTRRITCEECEGKRCSQCKNLGITYQDVILEININANAMNENGSLVYHTYGDAIKNLPLGDLIIKPIIKGDDHFQLKIVEGGLPGVESTQNVFETDAGQTVRVDTIQGKVDIVLPDKIKNNQVIRVKGKGLSFKNKTGDHYIILKFI